ncbi:MAG: extracellular solute-binding protein [Propionibacteriaceae bacterium]|nr:extracellular solute-binding protein [Propionibacteriaceae bacterium]
MNKQTSPLKFLRLAVVSALALGLTACAPGSQAPDTAPTAAPVTSIDPASAGEVTLRLTDFWGANEGEWIESMVAQFEAKYPNIHIERTQEDWGQLTSTLNLQISEEAGPDIATANNGWQSLGTLAKGNLVLNLDQYAAAFGWDKLIPSTIARQNEFSTDFTKIGEGSLFGTPIARVQPIGIYYNIEKLTKLNVAPPATFAEFEAAAKKAKDAGEIPINYGSQDSPTAALLALQAVFGTAGSINDYVYGNPAVTAEQTGLTKAAETVQRWNEAGWFTPDHAGIDYQTAVANFVDGKGIFRFEYQGSLGLSVEQQSKFGYIQMRNENGGTVGVGASPAALVIATKCKNPDVAAAFLDFLMSQPAAQTAVDNGLIPLLHSDVTTPANMPLLKQEIEQIATIGESDGYVPYFDWASPGMLDVLVQQMQLMYGGRATPAELSTAVDVERNAFLAESAS